MMGTESPMTMYFTDNGNTQCSDVKISMMGITKHQRSIQKGKTMYNLDMDEKTYTVKELTEEELKNQVNYMSDEKLEEEGINKDGTEEFLGKKCTIYSTNNEGADVKFWSWEGLMLKTESSAQGMTITITAKTIDESVQDKSIFEVPEGFTKKD